MTPEQIARELEEKARNGDASDLNLINAAAHSLHSGGDSEGADRLVALFNRISASPAAILVLLEERKALREALEQARSRLFPLTEAIRQLEPTQPTEKALFADVGDQIAELSRLMIVHANAAKRFALIGKDIYASLSEALALATKEPNNGQS